jgi:hypothetical protein
LRRTSDGTFAFTHLWWSAEGPAEVLRPLLRHGLLRERTADLVTDAFRFWLTHPAQDYGYALRLAGTPGTAPQVVFYGADTDQHQKGPVLTLTYRLAPGGAPRPGAAHLYFPRAGY